MEARTTAAADSVTDLLIRGGRSSRATGRGGLTGGPTAVVITAIEPSLEGPAAAADRVDRCDRDAGPPRRRRRPHPHPRRERRRSPIASSRIRWLPRSAARRRSCRSTTPGRDRRRRPSGRCSTGLTEWRAATDARQRHRLRPLARRSPAMPTTRSTSFRPRSRPASPPPRRSWSSTSACADQRLFDAMRVMGERGGMLQVHCEDPVLLDAAVAAALQRGDTLPRYHATSRPPYVEAVATARALAFARATDSPVHVVHLSSAAALDEVRAREGGRRARHGRDVSALPRADRGAV